MAGLKVYIACCLHFACAIAISSLSCSGEHRETDEVQLLQASKRQDGSSSKSGKSSALGLPDLGDIFKKATGALDKLGGVIETGVKSATSTVDSVLEDANGQLEKIETSCNKSFKEFDAAASINGSISDNITKFQGLVNGTMGKYLKMYSSLSDKLMGAIHSVSSTLKLAGQGDLADELNTTVSAAVSKLEFLSVAGQSVVAKAAETSAERVGEKIPEVKTAIQSTVGAAGDFATTLVDAFRKVSDQLLEFVKSKVPKEAQEALGKPLAEMIEKAQATAEKLEKAVTMTSDGLDRSADTVASSAQSLSSPGFFGKIKDFFSHVFR